MAASTLREEGIAGVKLDPWLVVGPVAAVSCDTHVARGDTLHRAVEIEQDLGCGETRKDLDTKFLGLAREPPAEIAQAQRVGAAVVHESGHEELREGPLAPLGKHPMVVLGHRDRQRRALLL